MRKSTIKKTCLKRGFVRPESISLCMWGDKTHCEINPNERFYMDLKLGYVGQAGVCRHCGEFNWFVTKDGKKSDRSWDDISKEYYKIESEKTHQLFKNIYPSAPDKESSKKGFEERLKDINDDYEKRRKEIDERWEETKRKSRMEQERVEKILLWTGAVLFAIMIGILVWVCYLYATGDKA